MQSTFLFVTPYFTGTFISGPIFFEFTVELVYPVPEGVVGGFLTCVYNAVGMIFLFSFYIPGIGKLVLELRVVGQGANFWNNESKRVFSTNTQSMFVSCVEVEGP